MKPHNLTLLAMGLLLGLAGAKANGEGPQIPGLLFYESFDDADLRARGWYDGNRFQIVEEGARAGAGCIEFRWEEGGTTPVSSSGIRRQFTPTPVVYLRYYIRLSSNWGWSPRTWHPHLAHFLTTENGPFHGPARSRLTIYIEPVGGKLRLGGTDMQNVDAPHGLTQGPLRGGYNGRMYESGEVVFKNDQWHCVEAMFKLNSVDVEAGTWAADGEVRGWIDGELVVEHTNVIWRTVDYPEMQFNQFLLTPYFGPGLLPHAQTLWIDELAVGTERIGPIED